MLIVDVLSVKEHPRKVLLGLLPNECDVLCTHPMFGPDPENNGWHGLNFVYERTHIDGVILNPTNKLSHQMTETYANSSDDEDPYFIELRPNAFDRINENSHAHNEGKYCMKCFLSIWEEEGCCMVAMSSAKHDTYASNSQFITHLMGQMLG